MKGKGKQEADNTVETEVAQGLAAQGYENLNLRGTELADPVTNTYFCYHSHQKRRRNI